MAPMIDPGSSIPELIKFIRYSFRECEFDEVQNILMEREKSMKAEIENVVRDRDKLKKQVDFLENSKGYTELEKCDLEEKLGRSQRRGEELDRMIAQTKEKFEKLRSGKQVVEEKLGRSSKKCEEMDEMRVQMKDKFEKLSSEKHDVEAKLVRSSKKCEEMDEIIVQMKEKFEKLSSEKRDVEEKLVRSSEKCEEMDERLVEMGKEIEELRRESLSANETIEELKARETEADRVVQTLKRKNVEAAQTIDELRSKKMKSDKAAEFYENDLDPRILKLERAVAKMLSVNVEDLASLANGADGFAAAATDAEVEENLENGEADSDAEDRAIVSPQVPAISGSHTSAMQSGGEMPAEKTVPSSSSAGNVVIVIDDSDSDDETSIPDTSSWQTNKRNRTDSGEDSPMNFTKRRKIGTSATPSRCRSLPSRLEERADTLQKSRAVDYMDSTDSDDESISDAYMNNLIATFQSRGGSKKD